MGLVSSMLNEQCLILKASLCLLVIILFFLAFFFMLWSEKCHDHSVKYFK